MRRSCRPLFKTRTAARCLGAAIAAACLCGGAASAQSITVAAASDLQTVMPKLASRFQQQTGLTIRTTFGSSGNFFSQIQNGAPFDVFLSADVDYPRRLEAAGLVEPGSLGTYAYGRIVLWSRKDRAMEVNRGLQALLDPAIRRISVANPQHAPYGRAAVAALRREQIYERVQTKLVFGENVSQAAQFVDSGNADAGLIALSLALDPALKERGTFYEIPASFYPPIEQAGAVIKASPSKAAAREFLAFLQTPDARGLLQDHGFALPTPSGRASQP